MKESLSGYLTDSMDVAKFKNLIRVQQGSLDFNPDAGFDMAHWLKNADTEFSERAFNAWIKKESLINNVLITAIESDVSNFSLNMKFTISGKTYNESRG